MSNPQVHAERSAKKWGGMADDYLAVHRWFDATASHLPDNRHRMVLHNGFGIALAEQVFGSAITNSDGKRVFVREIGQQHVLEDLGYVPSLADCLRELPLRPWMAGARKVLATPVDAECQADGTIWELKAQMLKKSGLLALHHGHESFSGLGGLQALKSFCSKAMRQRITVRRAQGRGAYCCSEYPAVARVPSARLWGLRRGARS